MVGVLLHETEILVVPVRSRANRYELVTPRDPRVAGIRWPIVIILSTGLYVFEYALPMFGLLSLEGEQKHRKIAF